MSPSGAGAVFVVSADGGEPRKIIEGRGLNDPISWAPDSKRVCFSAGTEFASEISAVDVESGRLERILTDAAVDRSPCWSQDGREIVFSSNRSAKEEIWSMDPRSGALQLLTNDGGNTLPALSPARDRLAWRRQGEGLVILERASGREDRVPTPKTITSAPSWSPDGRFIAVTAEDRDGGAGVYLITSDGRSSLLLTKSTAGNGMPAWSPDGARLAVVTNDHGDVGIWVLSGLGLYLDCLRNPAPLDTLERMR
jgi:TolB protein